MRIVRCCPACGSEDLVDAILKSRYFRPHFGVKCLGCERVLTKWDVIDGDSKKLIARAGDMGAVKWPRPPSDNIGKMTGRDDDGMAL